MWFASRHSLILRGLVTIAFGLLLFVWPIASIAAFILLFGFFAVIDGAIILAASAFAPAGEPGRGLALAAGMFAIVIGIVTFFSPGLTEFALIILVAARAIVVGGVELATAFHLGRDGGMRRGVVWLLAAAGCISLVFGALLLLFPAAGIVALVWVIGLYAIAIGIIALAKAALLSVPTRA